MKNSLLGGPWAICEQRDTMWGETKNNSRDSIGNAGAYHGVEKVIGDYKIRNILGEGAFATVFLAIQLVTGQQVALKLLKPDIVGNTQRRIERFDRETCLCAGLYHPNIVRLLDKGRTADGKLFAVFEYVPGETLKDLLLREGRLAAAAAGEVML
ncbi:MAG TPA: protein kinase, partial [Gammaproteobacteria bacterium]